jgi:hypothetical protein
MNGDTITELPIDTGIDFSSSIPDFSGVNMGNFTAPYIDVYNPDLWDLQTPDYTSDLNTQVDTSTTADTTDYSGSNWTSAITAFGSIVGSVGKAAAGILQAQQGAVVDPRTGRLVAIGGKAVTSYAPSGTLAGIVSGPSGNLLLLILIGLAIYFVFVK